LTPRQVRAAPARLSDFLSGTPGIPLAWPEWLRATMR
jgi:hypothetical protein